MKKREYVAYQAPCFKKMTSAEILAYFAKYHFVDQENHKLELCEDFIQLVGAVANHVEK